MYVHFCKSIFLILFFLNVSQYGFSFSENRFQRERNFHYQNRVDFDSDTDFGFDTDFDSDGDTDTDTDSTGLDTDSLTKPPKPTQTHRPTPKPTTHSKYTPIYIRAITGVIASLGFGVMGVYLYMTFRQYCGTPDLIAPPPQSTADPFANSDNCIVINPDITNSN